MFRKTAILVMLTAGTLAEAATTHSHWGYWSDRLHPDWNADDSERIEQLVTGQ